MTSMQKFLGRGGDGLPAAQSLAAIGLALSFPATASAQGKKKAEAKEPEQAYMLPYIITVTAILVGLAVVCMPSQQQDEVDMSSDLS